MKYFDFSCPFCRQKFSVAPESNGKSFKCPTCGQDFIIGSGNENFHSCNTATKHFVNYGIAKNYTDNLVIREISEQIKQLKSEIASKTKIFKNIENRTDTLNTMFLGFLVLWSFAVIVGALTIVINFSDINDSLNKLQKMYKSPNHIEEKF